MDNDAVVENTTTTTTDAVGNVDNSKVEMPPEIEKRFNKIYKEMKTTKERNSALEEHALKLTNALIKLQSDTKDASTKSVISDIKQQIRQARDAGNEDELESLQEKLTELMVEEKLEKKLPKQQPKQPVRQEHSSFELTKSEERIVGNWATEVDEDDEPLRPWAQSENHPKAQKAYEYLTEILEDDQYADLTIKEKLALVDEKFLKKAKATRDVNAVGAGSLTKNNDSKQDKLTDDQKRVAYRIFSRLSKEDAEKKYAEGLKAAGMK
jgi:hypothetical protein